MNQLATEQNTPPILQMLAAQRQLYTEAKRWMIFRFCIALLIALIPVFNYFFSAFAVDDWVILLPTLGVAIVFPQFVKKWEQAKIDKAASIQEIIDLQLLGIEAPEDWGKLMPLKEEIVAADQRFRGDRKELETWYDPPPPTDRDKNRVALECQKYNLWWDSTQRKFFQNLFLSVAGVILVGVLVWAFQKNICMQDFAKMFSPVLPLLQFFWEKYFAQKELTQKQEQKLLEINAQLESGQAITPALLRRNQDFIFKEIRLQNALVPDEIYKKLKKRIEKILRSAN
jgi:hypothetical protein